MKHSKAKLRWAISVLSRAKKKSKKAGKRKKARRTKRRHTRRDPKRMRLRRKKTSRSRSAAAKKAARTRARKAAARRAAARKAARTRARKHHRRDPSWYGDRAHHARAARKGWRKRRRGKRRDPVLFASGDPRRYRGYLGRRQSAVGAWYTGYRDPE